MADPLGAGVQRPRIEPAGVHAPLHFAADQAGALEHLDVLGGAGERDVEGRGEFADRARLARQRLQHGPSGRVGEGLEEGVEGGLIVNHVVDYTRAGRIVNRLVKYSLAGRLPSVRSAAANSQSRLTSITPTVMRGAMMGAPAPGADTMRATIMYNAGDVRVEDVPDPTLVEPTDAIVRVTRACICGSDLWPYKDMQAGAPPQRMGHEAIGVVEAVGRDVRRINPGDFVIMPFSFSDGRCDFCEEGLFTSCVHGGFFGMHTAGAQAEALRIPQADGTLYALPAPKDEALMASLLSLSDVMGTGHHAALGAKVGPGKRAAVVGDGAVGLCGVIAARRLGAEQIIVMGRHPDRIALAREFGATDVVSERGEAAVERVRELTGGFGVHSVLECVGSGDAMQTAAAIARPGGAIGRVGVPHYEGIPSAMGLFLRNVSVGGGPAPVRGYIAGLLQDVIEGRIQPGRVFDRTVGLEGVPDGYRAMDARESIKVMVKP